MMLPDAAPEAVDRAFGADNRARLLARYFGVTGPVTTADAWQHVYRLLLWIDRTIGLAHCYESGKAQPGRAWYSRALAFHAWVSEALGTAPASLGENVDWLFHEAVKDLAGRALTERADAYVQQRTPTRGAACLSRARTRNWSSSSAKRSESIGRVNRRWTSCGR